MNTEFVIGVIQDILDTQIGNLEPDQIDDLVKALEILGGADETTPDAIDDDIPF